MRREETKAAELKKFVEYIVKSLVEYPDDVLLAQRVREGDVYLELKVAPSDVGRVIGKNGSTINAIRTVAQAMASSQNLRFHLNLIG